MDLPVKKDKHENKNVLLAIALMFVFALSRIPGVMPENFSAAYAIAFCAGVYFPGALAWWLPLGTMLLTDIILNLFYYHQPALSLYILVVYFVYAFLIFLGRRLGRNSSFLSLLSGGILGALIFYIVTNTFSWLFDPGYSKSFFGWIQALTTGLPGYPPTIEFFKNTLLSSGLFTGLFVGSMKLVEKASEEEETEEQEEPEPEEDSEKAKA